MASNMGVETFLSVFLLCCWQATELQPIKTTSGEHPGKNRNCLTRTQAPSPATSPPSVVSREKWSSSRPTMFNVSPTTEAVLNSTTENIPETLDEILAQEILEPKTTAVSETSPRPRSPVPTTVHIKEIINSSTDENYQEEAFENYHEFQENLEHSSTKEKNGKNDRTTENLCDHSSQTKLEPHLNPEEEKNSNGDVYRKLPVLDRLLENIGQSEGSLELTESIF